MGGSQPIARTGWSMQLIAPTGHGPDAAIQTRPGREPWRCVAGDCCGSAAGWMRSVAAGGCARRRPNGRSEARERGRASITSVAGWPARLEVASQRERGRSLRHGDGGNLAPRVARAAAAGGPPRRFSIYHLAWRALAWPLDRKESPYPTSLLETTDVYLFDF